MNTNCNIKAPFINKINIPTTNKIFPQTDYVLYFDGCSKGNPGPSGIGAVIYKDNKEIWASFDYIGDDKTNNQAEYSAVILGLTQAIYFGIKELDVFGDSELIIKQINEIYKVRNKSLLSLYEKTCKLKDKFTYITFTHVYRDQNKRADELANTAVNINYNKILQDTEKRRSPKINIEKEDWTYPIEEREEMEEKESNKQIFKLPSIFHK